MIDTHSHIYLPEFDNDRISMLQRAKDAGVSKIFLPNIDASTAESMLQLCAGEEQYCYPMMGLHPCSVKKDFESEIEIAENYLNNSALKFYGIGECGLDHYWSREFDAEQFIAFEMQILFAKKYALPIIIHSREATQDCIDLIAKHKDDSLHGIFHCFSGTAEQLERIIELDFYAGIGGVITFKNGGLDKILKEEHLPNLVLETDAPYLTPVPFRGKRNEPSYLQYVVKKLSEVTGADEKEVIAITSHNAAKIFSL